MSENGESKQKNSIVVEDKLNNNKKEEIKDDTKNIKEQLKIIEESFKIKESNTTWQAIDDAIKELATIIQEGKITKKQAIDFITKNKEAFENSIKTDRTRLTGTSVMFMEIISIYLKDEFVQIVDWVVPTILSLTVRTNKITVNRAINSLSKIAQSTQLEQIIKHYHGSHKHISQSQRKAVSKLVLDSIKHLNNQVISNQYFAIEDIILCYLVDALPEVREVAKESFKVYCEKYPHRKESFVDKLSSQHKKYLKLEKESPEPSLPFKQKKGLVDTKSNIKDRFSPYK